MLNRLTLKNKLALSASFTIICGISVLEAVNFNTARDKLNRDTESQLLASVEGYNHYVSGWLASKQRTLEALPSTMQEESVLSHLEQVRDSGAFDNVFLAYADGSQQNANGVVLPPGNDDPREWGWYINALKMPNSVFIDEPTVAAATGANVVSMGKSVHTSKGQSVLGADVEIGDIIEGLHNIELPSDGVVFMANQKGNVFVHENVSLLNQSVDVTGVSYSSIQQAIRGNGLSLLESSAGNLLLVAQTIPDTEFTTVTVIDHDALIAPLKTAAMKRMGGVFIVLLICISIFNLICTRLFRPLGNISHALNDIASGQGDLTKRLDVESNDEIGQLAKQFNTFIDTLQQLIIQVRNDANTLTQSSLEGATRAEQATNVLVNQQSEVAMIATAVTQMSSATTEIASHADNTAQAALSSTENTQSGHQLVVQTKESIHSLANEMNEANQVISDLDSYANDISKVLATIREIAEQTNLLALNAAIEAARAGSQGRGFSVVADEVRVLSQRTHSSTEEIKSTIETLQKTTAKAVSLMESSSQLASNSVTNAEDASEAINEINESVKLISDMAAQIATAAQEQSHVTQDISNNINALKSGSDNLANVASNALGESNTLSAQSQALSDKVAVFKLS